jgi:hypothetical protein
VRHARSCGTGSTPGGQGHFDGYDVLGQVATWDHVTAGTVLARLGPPQPLRFFTPSEEPTAAALFDQLLAQWDEPRVPVLAMVDARLNDNLTDGWHYGDMPPDQEAWHRSLAGLDEDANEAHGVRFGELSRDRQAAVLQAVLDRGDGRWRDLQAARVWSLWTRYACTAFYADPFAWNEIGFGGPAYPRGYKNVGLDKREPWERPDRTSHDVIPDIRKQERQRRAEERRGGAG